MKILFAAAALTLMSGCAMAGSGSTSYLAVSERAEDLPAFTSVVLRGGGELTLRYSDAYSLQNTGDQQAWDYRVEDGVLTIKCHDRCSLWHNRSAVITLPRIDEFTIRGGGEISFEGAFEPTDSLEISINGGGEIDALAVPARNVDISIRGGGDISVNAEDSLNVSIFGGGEVSYTGEPEVSKSIFGGGVIRPIR